MATANQPTVFLGLGALGEEVVGRALQAAEEGGWLEKACGPPLEIASRLKPVLDRLLRAGRGATERAGQRLDLFAFAAGLQLGDDDLWRACEKLSELVFGDFGALFSPNLPPEQRQVGLQLVVVAPSLTTPQGAQVLARLARLEQWARRPGTPPLLAKVWVVPMQTSAGTVRKDEVVKTCADFALAAVASELRDRDEIDARLRHLRRGEGLFGFLSLASLDLPLARVRRYAAARAAHDALDTLVERVEKPATDREAAATAVAALRHATWLAPFGDGEAARKLKQVASRLSGGAPRLPEELAVGALEGPESVRARFEVLFQPATRLEPSSAVADEDLTAALRVLDRAEADSLAQVERGLGAVFHGPLAAALGLKPLPLVEKGLRDVAAALRDEEDKDGRESRAAEERTVTAEEADPHRKELDEALALLPPRRMAVAVGLGAGLALFALAAMATLALRAPGAASGPGAALAQPVLAGEIGRAHV